MGKRYRLIALSVLTAILVAVVFWWQARVPLPPVRQAFDSAASRVWTEPEEMSIVLPTLRAVVSQGLDSIEVCGYGKVALTEDNVKALDEVTRGAFSTLRNAAEILGQQERERERALGLHALSALARVEAFQQNPSVPNEAGAPWDAALARLATTTNDPFVYWLALQTCGGRSDRSAADGHCAQLSYRRWAQLDPDNAMPWLLILTAAAEDGTPGQADEALFRMSKSSRIDNYYGVAMAALLKTVAVGAAPQLEQATIGAALVGVESMNAIPQYAPLTKACSVKSVESGFRRQVCSDIAELMVNTGRTMLDHSIGSALARNLDWPPERLAALRDEADAAAALMLHSLASPEEMLTCSSLEQTQSWLFDVGELGEIGAIRQRLQASSRSVAEWAADRRSSGK